MKFFEHGNYYALGIVNLAKIDLLSMSLEYKYTRFFCNFTFYAESNCKYWPPPFGSFLTTQCVWNFYERCFIIIAYLKTALLIKIYKIVRNNDSISRNTFVFRIVLISKKKFT